MSIDALRRESSHVFPSKLKNSTIDFRHEAATDNPTLPWITKYLLYQMTHRPIVIIRSVLVSSFCYDIPNFVPYVPVIRQFPRLVLQSKWCPKTPWPPAIEKYMIWIFPFEATQGAFIFHSTSSSFQVCKQRLGIIDKSPNDQFYSIRNTCFPKFILYTLPEDKKRIISIYLFIYLLLSEIYLTWKIWDS